MSGNVRKGDNQKLKMLYLVKIFSEETDEQHGLTIPQIIHRLDAYGVKATRKTLYQDFDELRHFGLDIVAEKKGREWLYFLANRKFELPELKLLVDAVQAAKFITDRKSAELIKKLEGLVSQYQGKQLQRQVVISGRIKSMNESIYHNVDKLHKAIGAGRQIRFDYYRWNTKKKLEKRNLHAPYQVSPWALMWDNENYYLVAFDAHEEKVKHYRVDKMKRITITDETRLGQEAFEAFDMPRYSKSLFHMFGGDERTVTLLAKNELVGVLIDRFGQDIPLYAVDEEHVHALVDVAISKQFLGWVIALGDAMTIVSPEDVVEDMRMEIRRLAHQYGNPLEKI